MAVVSLARWRTAYRLVMKPMHSKTKPNTHTICLSQITANMPVSPVGTNSCAGTIPVNSLMDSPRYGWSSQLQTGISETHGAHLLPAWGMYARSHVTSEPTAHIQISETAQHQVQGTRANRAAHILPGTVSSTNQTPLAAVVQQSRSRAQKYELTQWGGTLSFSPAESVLRIPPLRHDASRSL